MRPLPRLLALTDDRVAALPDLGVRAAALAAAGNVVATVARTPSGNADQLASLSLKLKALMLPPMAQLFVTGRGDVAMAVHAQGVILRSQDLRPSDVREILPDTAIIASVHSESEAAHALNDGATGLLVGTIWESASHPGRKAAGVELVRRIATLGLPVWAIGGVNAARAQEAHDAGAWGVAAISAAWDADDPYQAALALTMPWSIQ